MSNLRTGPMLSLGETHDIRLKKAYMLALVIWAAVPTMQRKAPRLRSRE